MAKKLANPHVPDHAAALAFAMMEEAQAVAEKLGIRNRISIEKRIAGAEAVGAHKTSMLQDVEAGPALELEALVGSVIEPARLTETPTPHLDSTLAPASRQDIGGKADSSFNRRKRHVT